MYVEVPNRAGAVDARARLACYPRGSLYPLSSNRNHCELEDH